MILIIGGTGNFGRLLVARLLARGEAVRVMTRFPARAHALASRGAEIVAGDVRQPESVKAAVRGCTVVVQAAHGFGAPDVSPATVDDAGSRTVTDAARDVGAEVIMISIVGASRASAIDLFRAKAVAEDYLRASTVPHTIVRCTAFMETWSDVLGGPLRSGGRALVFGRGENPINFVSAVDVAALVERVLFDVTLRGQVLEFGGMSNYTMSECAALLTAALGKSAAPRHIPRTALRVMSTLMRPFKPDLARQASAAVVMDTSDMTFDAAAIRQRVADLPNTPFASVIASWATRPPAT